MMVLAEASRKYHHEEIVGGMVVGVGCKGEVIRQEDGVSSQMSITEGWVLVVVMT